MEISYAGPHDEVEVPSLGLVCKQNESIEVPDDVALEMIKQDAWVSSPTRVTLKKKD